MTKKKAVIRAKTSIGMRLFMVVIVVLLAGCGGSGEEDAPADTVNQTQPAASGKTVQLTVSAAASLTDSMKEIKSVYESNGGSVHLSLNFGGSGALQRQIEQGAPVDVFVSAAASPMQALTDKKLVGPERQKVLLSNDLAVVVPAEQGTALSAPDGLKMPDIKFIAIGEPGLPAGDYGREALAYYQLSGVLQDKFVFCKDVRQVLTYVEGGNAQAGIVYKTDALASAKVKIALTFDPQSHKPVEYPAGIVEATKHSKQAEDFLAFLQSEKAVAIFQKYGFTVPK